MAQCASNRHRMAKIEPNVTLGIGPVTLFSLSYSISANTKVDIEPLHRVGHGPCAHNIFITDQTVVYSEYISMYTLHKQLYPPLENDLWVDMPLFFHIKLRKQTISKNGEERPSRQLTLEN